MSTSRIPTNMMVLRMRGRADDDHHSWPMNQQDHDQLGLA